ncbi:imidazole glycerol phosphate synthase subunit hisH [Actinomyces ruminicola]|uniref:Imidazole glycerol phosphate synthase subunit HisH n=1 Tax=Actinomyces ruminicola TaxID=332524 RepID=A0A1G9Z7S4_9ACTO|nr:imidazole glycerol phosphate synthase subunit HisH [Actinomyces ruminicola]SDN17165.1 imidazole glycerol phosphate synthase subunit hisH [Actinomyces ruminicola]
MRQPHVVVLSYGSGNVRSAMRALERVGAAAELTADPDAVASADGLVVPGVGAFAAVMEQLRAVDAPRLIDRRLAGGRPVLGICVGMQVMFETSTEHTEQSGTEAARGLAQWPGTVSRLEADVVPHMGWSQVRPPADTVLFKGLFDSSGSERFYFVHSYAAKTDPAVLLGPGRTRPPRATWSTHGEDFIAAVENGALSATQFHPEKSGDAGAQLLRNWLTTL